MYIVANKVNRMDNSEKLGRPTVLVKDQIVKARLSKEGYIKLNKYCELLNKTKSEVIRDGIDLLLCKIKKDL